MSMHRFVPVDNCNYECQFCGLNAVDMNSSGEYTPCTYSYLLRVPKVTRRVSIKSKLLSITKTLYSKL